MLVAAVSICIPCYALSPVDNGQVNHAPFLFIGGVALPAPALEVLDDRPHGRDAPSHLPGGLDILHAPDNVRDMIPRLFVDGIELRQEAGRGIDEVSISLVILA